MYLLFKSVHRWSPKNCLIHIHKIESDESNQSFVFNVWSTESFQGLIYVSDFLEQMFKNNWTPLVSDTAGCSTISGKKNIKEIFLKGWGCFLDWNS
jgi:hypothetical protein